MNNTSKYLENALNALYVARCNMCNAALELYRNEHREAGDDVSEYAYELSKLDDRYTKTMDVIRQRFE